MKCKLGDLIDVSRGMSLPGKYYSEEGELIRLTLGNFDYEDGFKFNTAKSDIYYVGEVKDEFLLKKGDIITPLTEQTPGLLGSTARIPISDKFIASGDVAIIKPDENLIDKSFCYYLISSPLVKKQLSVTSQQTKIRHTSPDKIKDVIVFLPDLNKQKRIGELLDSISFKIDNNSSIINQLESLSKTLFNYWFIQFEFPNEDGKPYASSGGKLIWNEELQRKIPENWSFVYAKEIVDVLTGKEDANFATENGEYPFFTCAHEILKCPTYKFSGKSILIAGNGDFNVKYYEGKFNAYQRTYVLTPNQEKYVGILYQNAVQRITSFKFGSTGSIVKFITKSDVENIELLIPDNLDLLNPFNDILDRIVLLKKENDYLRSLRNFLVPLLMNGQIDFKD